INLIRALDQTEYAGINFSAQGYITYSYGSDAYLEDTASGIQLHGTALGDTFSAGEYVIIDGVIGTYNNNIQIDNVTLVEKVVSPTQEQPSIHPLADATEISTYMHRSVSITNAVVTSVEYASSNMYQVRFGSSNQYVTYLNIDNSNSLNLEQGDELQIVRGLVFNKKFTFDKTQGAQDVLTLKCANNTDYVVVKSNSVQEIIENGTDGQDVLTKGVVTYVDNANSLFVLQYNGYGIVVKVNNGTNKEITQISAGQNYKVAGTLTKTTETYITATILTTRSGSEETVEEVTLADYLTHNLQYVNAGTVKISAVTDAHTYTITDGTNTATLITAYEKGLHLYDYITVKAVVYQGNLVTSDEADIENLMISTKDFYSLPNNYSHTVYMRGTVTYIEIDIHNSQEGIENFIIQTEVDGVNYATRVYVGNTLLAKDTLKLGDVVTVIGDFDYDNTGTNPTQRRQIRRNSSKELVSDIVHGTPIEAEVFNMSQITRNANDSRLNGRYVKLEGVKLDEIIVDSNDSIVAILSKNGKQIKLYFSKNNAISEIDDKTVTLDVVKNIFYEADIYEGDTFDIVGNFNYYKPKNSISSIDGIRLELNLGGLKSDGVSFDTVLSKSTTDYISNQVKTEYTLKYINSQNVVVRTETLRRNVNFRTLDVISVPGKVFTGWDDSGVVYNANTNYAMPTHDLTLRATYTDKTYTVTFVTGTEEVINDITGLEYNMRIALPNPAITKANCTFGGWYMDENYSKAFTANTTITEDTTLYARWREKSSSDDSTAKGGTDVTLVVIISVASTLVVVGGGILVVYFIKNRKKK
ncbi:MAG: InlB B-repeat-containing protein, partial [Clostridia bacterium]|nr:InlB B-repeat-containing protein [Clostridia bacterium]